MNIRLLMISLAVFGFLSNFHQNAQVTGNGNAAKLEGTIVDINDARVPKAVLVFQGQSQSQTVETNPDGKYSIHLNPGVYTVSVSHWGYCGLRRAAFLADSGANIRLNFQLWACPSDNFGKYEFVELAPDQQTHLKPLILFGERDESDDLQTFRGAVLPERYPVVLTYNLLTVRADTMIYSRKNNSVVATGNVVVEEGDKKKTGVKAEVVFHGSEPHVNFVQ